jgi:CHASE2 domain-containing sensor protein
MNSSDRLFVICQISNPQTNYPGVAPPPEIPPERHSFSTVVVDSDGALRRHLLAMTPPAASPCTPSRALSTKLALRYLAQQGISPQTTADGYLQLGTTIFKPLDADSGGYHNIDAWGHQVLLNYRSHRSPKDFVEQVTLRQVLNGQLNPNAVKDKIVLIGVTAPSRKDYFATPYSPYTTGLLLSKDMPGVILHAQMVSQIISAVLDRRPLLSVWPTWSEVIWIWSWALVGGVLSWRCKSVLRFGLVGGTLLILYSLCSGLLTQGYWVPLVPSTLTLVSTASGIFAYSALQTKRQQSTFDLKS